MALHALVDIRATGARAWRLNVPELPDDVVACPDFGLLGASSLGGSFEAADIELKVARGRARDIHPLLWVVSAGFVVYFAIDPVERLLGVT